LRGADVLLVPDGYATIDPDFPRIRTGSAISGPRAQPRFARGSRTAGGFVGWLDGAVLAAGVGVSSATFENAEEQGISSPGTLIRTRVAGDSDSPLADGVGRSRTRSGTPDT
jgi:hypothetical protein